MSPNRARCVRFPLLRLFLANVVEHANHRDVRARASARNKMSVRQDRVDVVEQLLRENAGSAGGETTRTIPGLRPNRHRQGWIRRRASQR